MRQRQLCHANRKQRRSMMALLGQLALPQASKPPSPTAWIPDVLHSRSRSLSLSRWLSSLPLRYGNRSSERAEAGRHYPPRRPTSSLPALSTLRYQHTTKAPCRAAHHPVPCPCSSEGVHVTLVRDLEIWKLPRPHPVTHRAGVRYGYQGKGGTSTKAREARVPR